MIEFSVDTPSREVLVDITSQVQEVVASLHAVAGVVHVSVPHTTAGITINEGADPSVGEDVVGKLADLVPRRGGYRHGEGNSDAHIKTVLTGSTLALPMEEGRVVLGTWQAVFLAEFDGPRKRRVLVQVTPSLG